jgi:hypothetical protein
MNDTNNTSTDDITNNSSSVKFILLLFVDISSICCTLTILTYFIRHWHSMIRKALRNHIILLLVMISLINTTLDLPFTINSYRLGYDYPRTASFCLWWYWIDYTLIVNSILLMTLASVQRHVLIFHSHWLTSSRTRHLVHFFPMIFCTLYPSLFYFCIIVVHQCTSAVDSTSDYCSEPCYASHPILFNIDWILNTACPLLTALIANIILIVRVIRSLKRTHRQQSLTWKRQRKLTVHILSLSSLYIFGWMPATFISVLQSFALPTLLDDVPALDQLHYITYFVCPLQPFVCFLGIPELIKFIQTRLRQVFGSSTITPLEFKQNHRP